MAGKARAPHRKCGPPSCSELRGPCGAAAPPRWAPRSRGSGSEQRAGLCWARLAVEAGGSVLSLRTRPSPHLSPD